ncbi:hypothetical protein F5Y06DRAFT_274599 [Hypoxylon sp. FL0890]|nr:hypothetical protein F5Y06DRAFT_274599 [Hypoxylon sp. FL0890]
MAPSSTWFFASVMLAAVTSALPDGPKITPPPANPNILAINPTSSGQIGINPVTSDLGDPYSYVLTKLGSSNPVVTWDGSVYHYIEGHTNYLTVETKTTTVNNIPTTTTSTVKVSVETAVAGGDTGQEAGALGITFSKDIADNLRKTAEAAIQKCGVTRKRSDVTSCLIEAASSASGEGGPLEGAASDAFWESIKAEVAENASSVLKDAIAVIKSQARKKKTLILVAVFLTATVLEGVNDNDDNSLAAINIPAAGVGSTTNEDKNTCPPEKRERTKNSPPCDDSDCKGPHDTQRCTEEANKDCPCLLQAGGGPKQVPDQSWWDEQQAVIASVIASPEILTATADCLVNSHGNAFDGKPVASPASWCVCDSSGISRLYPTNDSPSSPCSYVALPTTTVSVSLTAPHGGKVTSCRIESYAAATLTTTLKPYCTCNDNSMYPIGTWTDNGSQTTGCTPTRATSSSTTTPPPTSSAPPPPQQPPPPVNEPPPNTNCRNSDDCSSYTCSDGSRPGCGVGGGDPFSHYCAC